MDAITAYIADATAARHRSAVAEASTLQAEDMGGEGRLKVGAPGALAGGREGRSVLAV